MKQGWPADVLHGRGRQLLLFAFIVVALIILILVVGTPGQSSLSLSHASKWSDGDFTHLIIVAGHAIYTGVSFAESDDEAYWNLHAYQKGTVPSFLLHIQKAVEMAAEDASALLIFSGGATSYDAGPRSEAESYWYIANARNWFGHEIVRNRAITEEFARDSFQNLMFSICRFREVTGSYPKKITMVSFAFKRVRFEEHHRVALRLPEENFAFVGVDMDDAQRRQANEDYDKLHVISAFTDDPYGCSGTLLEKRATRNPFMEHASYPAGCPELSQLFAYCGKDVFSGALPW